MEWIDFEDVDLESDVDIFRIDTRDFHCLAYKDDEGLGLFGKSKNLNILRAAMKNPGFLKNIEEFQLTKEELKELILKWKNIPERPYVFWFKTHDGGWSFKYTNIYKNGDKYFIGNRYRTKKEGGLLLKKEILFNLEVSTDF